MDAHGPPSPSIARAVLHALGRGATILTANQRAARTLRRVFDREQRAAGLASWTPPAILNWDAWTASLWQRLLLEGRATSLLLNRAQEHQVWRSVLEADRARTNLQTLETTDALATLAADAWQRLHAYNAFAGFRAPALTPDTLAFQRWARAFHDRCTRDGYLTQPELEAALESAFRKGFAPLDPSTSPEILLVGFDTLAPAREALLAALGSTGVESAHAEQAPPQALHLYAADDLSAELRAAAHWLRERLEHDPAARLAVILPSPDAERGELDRVFREILAPELLAITSADAPTPYEFSLGQPLRQSPLIALALDLLRFTRQALPLDAVSRLLLSPWLASDAKERAPRAEFDAFELRRATLLRPELTLDALIGRLESSRRVARLPRLISQLRALRRTAQNVFANQPQRAYADWADAIRELLEAANWATTPQQDTLTFQLRQKWESILDELATLDFEGARPTFAEALTALETLAAGTLFAPESRNAPIQIIGPLEAAGSEFDAIWFLRAADLSWPVRPATNPLLGWHLQREVRMPGADPTNDRALALRVTERIAVSAPTVVFSYAAQTADAHQRPATLLAGLALSPLELPEPEPAAIPIDLEAVADFATLIPLANPEVRGGSAILKAQAACAFRAFAEHRLHSTDLDTTAPGLDAAERGSLVHVTLQHFWAAVQTQATLKSLSPEARTAALDRAIDQAFTHARLTAANAWETAYLGLQRERLHRLLTPWLHLELARALPFEVRSRENRLTQSIGPLNLTLQTDRIDRTSAGDVLIDYKTGGVTPASWESDRPDEPQLPLYAVLHALEHQDQTPLAAVAFASLRPGTGMDFTGYAAVEGIVPKPRPLAFPSLEDQISDWHRVVTQLAQDFADGRATVDPKSYPTTCQYCSQRLLCRIDPASLAPIDPDQTYAADEEETHA